jgi:phosphonate degradation associated HDIG domain protein
MLRIEDILHLYKTRGAAQYGGEAVTQLEHALQCAGLAEQTGASPDLVVACLLHDLGHLLRSEDRPPQPDTDDLHQYLAIPFVRGLLPDGVLEPIRLHVDAKRYLCYSDPAYWEALSPASKRSLELQGGRFDAQGARGFLRHRHAEDAVLLRRFDDLAKDPAAVAPPLERYARLLRGCALVEA